MATKHEEDSVLHMGKGYDLAVWYKGDAAGWQTKRALNRHQELKDLKGGTYLYLNTKSVDSSGNQKIRTGHHQNGTACSETGSNRVSMYPPGDDSRGEIFRKWR